MIKHNIIVVGTSAGGVQTLCELTKYLPEDFDASIFVVMISAAKPCCQKS